jgi:hypothetical protein
MYWLLWFDDTKGKSAAAKIAGGVQAYRERYGVKPTQVLVNEKDVAVVPGTQVEIGPFVRPNLFWIGPVEA